jgi:coniferyl-aldehyde dehydrogenase
MSQRGAVADVRRIAQSMREDHASRRGPEVAVRRHRLERGIKLLLDHQDGFAKAMSADYGNRSIYQSITIDVAQSVAALRHAHARLEAWLQPELAEVPNREMKAWVVRQPLGLVGIVSSWQFPLHEAFGPLAGVLAAGNAALLKPSELTPRTSDLLAEVVPHYFDAMEVAVVLGGAEIGAALCALPLDHLVFTGSADAGRHVMRAAAEHLVPVTLALGGKTPVLFGQRADVVAAAERLLTGKTFNAGQFVGAPDLVMMTADQVDPFIVAALSYVRRSYPTLLSNPDYTSIISNWHFDRLLAIIDDAKAKGSKVLHLGPEREQPYDRGTRKIAPTLLLDVNDRMRAMKEEIGGPILAIKVVASQTAAFDCLPTWKHAPAGYFFGPSTDSQFEFSERILSGAVVINDVMCQTFLETVQLGGLGSSGMGAYHGVHGFQRFSHAKPVIVQGDDGASNMRLRTPYDDKLIGLKATMG